MRARRIAVVMTAFLVVQAGCGTQPQTTAEGPARFFGSCPDRGPAKVGLSIPIPIGTFKTYADVLQAQAAAAGYELVTTVADQDPGKQISDVDAMVQQDVDVLIIAPLGVEALKPAVVRAREAGLGVIGLQIASEGLADYDTSVTTANREAAEDLAVYLAAQIEADGKPKTVAVLNGPTFRGRQLTERAEGFDAGAQAAGLEIVDTQIDLQATPDSAAEIAGTWRQRHRALGGVLVYNDTGALGVTSALRPDWQPIVVSLNGEVAAIEAIRAGRLRATQDILPVLQAYAMAWAAEEAFCGRAAQLPGEILMQTVRVDAGNVGSWMDHDEQQTLAFTVDFERRDGATFLRIPQGFPFRQ